MTGTKEFLRTNLINSVFCAEQQNLCAKARRATDWKIEKQTADI